MKAIVYLAALLLSANLGVAVAAGSGEKEGANTFHGVSTYTIKGNVEAGTTVSANAEAATILLDPPVITNPNLTLFYAPSNMWQFTQIAQGGATYSFYVSSGSATLVQNIMDCYITTTGGATVCVVGTNSAGSGTPYCFYVPGI